MSTEGKPKEENVSGQEGQTAVEHYVSGIRQHSLLRKYAKYGETRELVEAARKELEKRGLKLEEDEEENGQVNTQKKSVDYERDPDFYKLRNDGIQRVREENPDGLDPDGNPIDFETEGTKYAITMLKIRESMKAMGKNKQM